MKKSELDAEFYESICEGDKPAPKQNISGLLATRARVLSGEPAKIGRLTKDTFDLSLLPETDALFYLEDSGILDKCIRVLQKIDIYKKQSLYDQMVKIVNHTEIIEILNHCHMIAKVFKKQRFATRMITNFSTKTDFNVIIFYMFTKSLSKESFYKYLANDHSIFTVVQTVSHLPCSVWKHLHEFLAVRQKDPRYHMSKKQSDELLKSTFNLFDYVFGIGPEEKRRHRL